MKFTSSPIAEVEPFIEIDKLEPMTLFETELGERGLRVYDGFVIFTKERSYPYVQARNSGSALSGVLTLSRKVRALPVGTTFTLVQDGSLA